MQHKISGGSWFLSGLIPALLALFGALLLLAVLYGRGVLSSDIMPETVIAAVFLSGTVSGLVCARKKGGGALIAGAVGGLSIAALILIGTIFTQGGRVISPEFLKLAIAALAGGVFGGALLLGRKSKIHKNYKKVKRR